MELAFDTTMYELFGTNGKTVHLTAPVGLTLPTKYVAGFGDYCGAGSGIGNTIVPESIFGIKVSPACFIHDIMWDEAPATWQAFHASNSIFLSNLISLIEVQSRSAILRRIRLYRAVTYYNAVDSIGQDIFWSIKGELT